MSKHFLVDPTAEIVNKKIPLFTDDLLGDDSRKDISSAMEKEMVRYGGIGLSANQIGLPFRMFIMGGHPLVEEGKVRQCWNPEIVESSKEKVLMKEGCLTFPFVFLSITRPRKVTLKYEDENGDLQEANLDGMISRIVQHEYDHILGKNFTDYASKLKLDRAFKKAEKEMDRARKLRAKTQSK